jgi:hypothetical protein
MFFRKKADIKPESTPFKTSKWMNEYIYLLCDKDFFIVMLTCAFCI